MICNPTFAPDMLHQMDQPTQSRILYRPIITEPFRYSQHKWTIETHLLHISRQYDHIKQEALGLYRVADLDHVRLRHLNSSRRTVVGDPSYCTCAARQETFRKGYWELLWGYFARASDTLRVQAVRSMIAQEQYVELRQWGTMMVCRYNNLQGWGFAELLLFCVAISCQRNSITLAQTRYDLHSCLHRSGQQPRIQLGRAYAGLSVKACLLLQRWSQQRWRQVMDGLKFSTYSATIIWVGFQGIFPTHTRCLTIFWPWRHRSSEAVGLAFGPPTHTSPNPITMLIKHMS